MELEFTKQDLLNTREIKTLITSDFTVDKAIIIANKLVKYCFISNGTLYILNDNITYDRESEDMKKKLVYKTSLLIQESFKALSNDNATEIKEYYKKTYSNIFKNSNIESYYPQLLAKLERPKVVFDMTIGEIHFQNGYIDLEDNVFKKRVLNKHYITEYIKRDYEKSSKDQKKALLKMIRKAYPSKKDFKCIMLTLGSALSGKSTVDQSTMFLLGDGSSGKSTMMLVTMEALGCYFKELKNDTFSAGNPKIDKILNTFSKSPFIRVIWVNEMKDVKIDETLFKSFCEGKLQSTKLYEDGQFNFPHYGKCFVTANTMPNIKIDSGVSRRFIGYTHTAKFVNDKDLVDEENNVHSVDKFFIESIIKMNYLNAWVDILCEYCLKWLQGREAKYTANFLETKNTVMDSNDIFQDFIDSKLTITNNPEDKIGKAEMHKAFSTANPNKHLTVLQVITSLKEKKIQYSSQVRSDNIKGSFIGVKLGDQLNEKEVKEFNLINASNSTKYQMELKEAKDEIKRLNELLAKKEPPKSSYFEIKPRNLFKKEEPVESKPKKKTKSSEVLIADQIEVGDLMESILNL